MAVGAEANQAPAAAPIPSGSPGPNGSPVARNASVYLVAQVLSWAVSFAYVSILPRLLAERVWGELAVVTSAIAATTGLFILGVDSYLVKEIGRDQSNAERLLGAALALRALLAIPAIGAGLIVISMLKPGPTMWIVGLVTILQACMNLWSEPLRSVLVGMELAGRASRLDLIANAGPLLAAPLVFFWRTPVILVVVGAVTMASVLAGRWRIVGRRVGIRPRVDTKLWIELIRGGLPFFVNIYIMQVYSTSAIFILRYYTRDDAAVGVYAAAMRFSGTFMFIPAALGLALLPSLARAAESDQEEFKRKQRRVLGLLMVMGLPVTATVIVLASPFCKLLFGPDKFVALPAVLQVSAWAIIPLYIVSTMYQFLVAQNRNGIWVFFMVGTAGLYCVLSSILTPWTLHRYGNGVLGAAASTVIVEVCSAVCAFILLRTNPLNAELIGRLVRAGLTTAAMASVMYLTRHMFILVPVVLGFGVFVLGGWWLHILSPDEERRVTAMWQSVLRRVRRRN
jgi:polysaccharide transporter, PST family